MTDQTPRSEITLYQAEDGQTRNACRFENETIWLRQKLMAELLQKDVRTINEHIQNVISEGELLENSVIRKFRITAADGKSYEARHYRLEMILAVGYRVRSPRGTQFRQWATSCSTEYLVKGFKPVAASKSSWRIGRPSWTNFFASMIGAFCQIPVKYPVS